MTINDIPAANAILNAIATALIIMGIVSIKLRKETTHRFLMVASLLVSAVFLVGYVYHKIQMQGVHTDFQGDGMVALVYYAMLISHILLAMAIVPLILRTVYLGIRNRRELHKKWARVTYPIWLYVSITGILIYQFLYVWYPQPETLAQ